MARKFTAVVALFLALFVGVAASASNQFKGFNVVNVTVNGRALISVVPAIDIDGVTMVPLRAFSAATGATATWDGSANTWTVSGGASAVPPQVEGFRGISWGSSRASVKAKETAKFVGDDGLRTIYSDIKLNNLDFAVGYDFTSGDKLARGGYVFTGRHSNTNDYISDYNSIKALLTEKYGKPVRDDVVWKNDLFKDAPQSYGVAVSAGHLKMVSQWQTTETRISLLLGGENFAVTFGVDYESLAYGDALKREKGVDALKDL